MELSRPPLVVAFELSEKRKAIVADALAGLARDPELGEVLVDDIAATAGSLVEAVDAIERAKRV